MKPKNPRKRPPHPADPRTQRLMFMAQSDAAKRRHRTEARYLQYANEDDLVYDVALRDGGYKCARCGHSKSLSLDHITPVCLGGTTEVSNLQLLCPACNKAKGREIIDYRPVRSKE